MGSKFFAHFMATPAVCSLHGIKNCQNVLKAVLGMHKKLFVHKYKSSLAGLLHFLCGRDNDNRSLLHRK